MTTLSSPPQPGQSIGTELLHDAPPDNRPALEDADRLPSVPAMVAQAARCSPESIALQAGTVHMSYRTLINAANRLAAELASIGVTRDVPVGICVGRSFDQIVAMLGVLRAGGAFLPLDPAWPIERLRFVLDDARAP